MSRSGTSLLVYQSAYVSVLHPCVQDNLTGHEQERASDSEVVEEYGQQQGVASKVRPYALIACRFY